VACVPLQKKRSFSHKEHSVPAYPGAQRKSGPPMQRGPCWSVAHSTKYGGVSGIADVPSASNTASRTVLLPTRSARQVSVATSYLLACRTLQRRAPDCLFGS
jgi:hypothetical protein